MNCSLSFTQQLSVASVAFSVVASVVFSCCVESSTPACGWIEVPVANVSEGASGATVSTGATSALPTILLDAKTLLTHKGHPKTYKKYEISYGFILEPVCIL